MNDSLEKTLKPRHLRLIALGGVIGAGLFVGSASVINGAGPAALVSYGFGGLLVILVMRTLGDLAGMHGGTGNFVTYAGEAFGPRTRFVTGWLYWYFWVIVVAFEATAGAAIIKGFIPSIPLWVLSVVLLAALTVINLLRVGNYGEFEYWFASIKIAAIVAFILFGVLALTGVLDNGQAGFSNLTAYGGFAPHGWTPVLTGIATLIFTYVGGEIVTVAAGEASEDGRAAARNTSMLIVRVLLFYICSLLLLVTVVPWTVSGNSASPFADVLATFHLPGAAIIINFVILTAVLSCLNSGIYVASRMLFTLAAFNDAPRALTHVNRKGVPVRAILLCTVVGYLSVIMAYVSPDTAFYFLTTSSGAVILAVYLIIVLSHTRLVKKRATKLPLLTAGRNNVACAAIILVLGSLTILPETRPQAVLGLTTIAALTAIATIIRRRRTAAGIERSSSQRTPSD